MAFVVCVISPIATWENWLVILWIAEIPQKVIVSDAFQAWNLLFHIGSMLNYWDDDEDDDGDDDDHDHDHVDDHVDDDVDVDVASSVFFFGDSPI